MKKYDLHKIMKAAHEIYRKYFYRAQNEAYMCRSAKNAVIGLCFSVLSAT